MFQQARFSCIRCDHTFKTQPGLLVHVSKIHQHPKPHPPKLTVKYHPHLTAQISNEDGDFLASGAPPPDKDDPSWALFQGRPSFEFAELMYKKIQCSAGDIDHLLNLWATHNVNNGGGNAIFENAEMMYKAIDSITHGNAPWDSFSVWYPGPTTADSPSWQLNAFQVHCQNMHNVIHNMLGNKEFDGKFGYIPFQEYTAAWTSRYSNLMSGQWAYPKAVSIILLYSVFYTHMNSHKTEIAVDNNAHGSMLVPLILGVDKTTVSVTTGQNEYHPVYLSIGNVDNSVRQAHCDALLPVAFLSIPKCK